jgi:hypothetical protein
MNIALENLDSQISWGKAQTYPALMKAVEVLVKEAGAKWYFFNHTGAYRLMWHEDVRGGSHFKEPHEMHPTDNIYAEQLVKDYLMFCSNQRWLELRDLGLKGSVYY